MDEGIKRVVFDLTVEQKKQLLKAWTTLGYESRKAWLLAHLEEDLKRIKEGEKVPNDLGEV